MMKSRENDHAETKTPPLDSAVGITRSQDPTRWMKDGGEECLEAGPAEPTVKTTPPEPTIRGTSTRRSRVTSYSDLDYWALVQRNELRTIEAGLALACGCNEDVLARLYENKSKGDGDRIVSRARNSGYHGLHDSLARSMKLRGQGEPRHGGSNLFNACLDFHNKFLTEEEILAERAASPKPGMA